MISQASSIEQVFIQCDRARTQGELIKKVSASDKEYHFQNWVEERLSSAGIDFDDTARNTYPDFRLVRYPEGYEVKGLAFPGREADYDANSQVPAGTHKGRNIYYIFGRYPKDTTGMDEYPVTDLVLCHGSFLNATDEYVHKNKSFRGFGSYGDILVRDRKMYVVPTPFALTDGTVGVSTLIVPEGVTISDPSLVRVGELERIEVAKVVVAYEFDLRTNEMRTHLADNPQAGRVHRFAAYRVAGHGDSKPVNLREKLATQPTIMSEES